jgi:Family of unknown function (DUF5670)
MLFGSSLLLVVWIIGRFVFEMPSRLIHVLPLVAVVMLVVHVMRAVSPKSSPRR